VIIGIPKEVKDHEYRVAATPEGVREAVGAGHRVVVEASAGVGSAITDDAFVGAGAEIVLDADAVFAAADLIVKVKEPQASEYERFRDGHLLFTYLHLAPDPDQARDLVQSEAVCIAYETVTSPTGGLPLLAPMSEVAGRMAVQAGAYYLEKPHGGLGVLIGGVLLTMVGHTVHVIQTLGWLPITAIPGVYLPYWMGQWFGLFATWQGLILQIAAAGFVIGSYFLAERQTRRHRVQPDAGAAAPNQAML